ncbi:hypothetical protein BGZ88_008974 [Linnemannia elongata]|nr:hypothetical protein BGZ88_008974 [Linnemannia elongata]
MGVLGLYSYFESKSLGQRKSWSATLPPPSSPSPQPGHDSSEAGDISTNNSLKRSLSPTPDHSTSTNLLAKRRFFILDGNAYIHHLYCGQFEWIWGGQYSSFVNLLTAHIRALENSGFRLQVLFDGPLPVQKRQTRLTRDTEKIRKMSRVVGDLEHYHVLGLGGGCNTLTSSNGTGVEALANRAGGAGGGSNGGSGGAGGAGGKGYSHFLIPPLVMEVTLQTLRALGVELLVCDGEADGLVAQLAMEKSMDVNVDEAYAVSKDSDYFIYNTGSSTKGGYIPLDSLFVSTDPTTGTTTVAATVYSQSAIAEHLGIRPHFLPLFASLTGNDYLRPDVFEDQVARSLAAATGQKLSAANNTNHARIKATATFLKQYGAGSGAGSGADGAGGRDDIKSVLAECDQVNGIMDEILKDREQLYAGETEERRQELRSALIESMEQYSPSIPDDFSTEESISSGESSLPSSEEPTPSTSIAASPNPSTPSAVGGLWAAPEKSSLSVVAALNKTKEAFRAGQFSFKLMDVVSNRMFWCTPFLEDTDRESAWLASRDLRRWIYGVLARDLLLLESGSQVDGALDEGEEQRGSGAELEVVEYVRRGDHLSAEIVMGASAMELDEMVKVVKAKAQKKSARRISVMDIDPVTPSSTSAVEVSPADTEHTIGAMEIEQQDASQPHVQDLEKGETMDEASRTSLFLGILGADTAQVRALPKPFMILAATLRYLINALAHSKTRSASISVANFEVIAFVASALFLREMYYPETIGKQPTRSAGAGAGPEASSIPTPSSTPLSTTLSGPPSLVEAPPMTKRSLHLSTQYQHALATVSLLASALHLEDMIPPLAQLFDGLLFQQTLPLARGGTLLEGRMQFPESVSMYHQILAAVEEDFVDTGEIDVVVVFRASRKGASAAGGTGEAAEATKLGIFGPDMEPLNQLPSSSSTTSTIGGSGLKGSKSAGIQKKSGSSKKRSGGGGGGGGSSSNSSSGRGGNGRGGGGGANMFNVLSLGCEF